ncbi:hypothetical protein [Cutibacterium porci]|uniref:hypothetical protein n=1 Tax=Cutibacterium porci TaxID=2605781 RepID=UPI0018A6C635|nr:hypothetical protein [Cutibacterium porci]
MSRLTIPPAESNWEADIPVSSLVQLLPAEFLVNHHVEVVRVVQPPDRQKVSAARFLRDSLDYATYVQDLITAGVPVVICPVGELPCRASAIESSRLRKLAASVLQVSWPEWLRRLIAIFEKNASRKLEDGSMLVDGSLQLPYGELWWDGAVPFTGTLPTAAGQLSLRDGYIISAPAGLDHLLYQPIVELGVGLNPRAPLIGPSLEKRWGFWHIGLGASSPIHLLPPNVHHDVSLILDKEPIP